MTGCSVLVDTHVHLYKIFDLDKALKNACENMFRLDPRIGLFALCLTERAGDYEHAFDAIPGCLKYFEVTESNSVSIALQDPSSRFPPLLLIRGRQFVSQEKIEVLGLGYPGEDLKSMTLPELVNKIESQGGVPVLPWSPGKWIGKRGNILQEFLTSRSVCLGDILMRPKGFSKPSLFSQSLSILPGSDPLPLEGEEDQIGRYCAKLEVNMLLPEQILGNLKTGSVVTMGSRNSIWNSILRQIRLRLRR